MRGVLIGPGGEAATKGHESQSHSFSLASSEREAGGTGLEGSGRAGWQGSELHDKRGQPLPSHYPATVAAAAMVARASRRNLQEKKKSCRRKTETAKQFHFLFTPSPQPACHRQFSRWSFSPL